MMTSPSRLRLPIFSWAKLRRDGQFYLNQLSPERLTVSTSSQFIFDTLRRPIFSHNSLIILLNSVDSYTSFR